MARGKSADESADRRKWNKIFDGLVRMIRSQQTQLESMVTDREMFIDRIRYLQDHISQMGKDFELLELDRMVEAAKAEVMEGLKHKKAAFYKHKLENTEDELADFREWFDYLSQKCAEPKDMFAGASSQGKNKQYKALESELSRLKIEKEKYISDKNSEISALLSEKSFIWNQYNKMENDFSERLKKKNIEVERSNEKIQGLLSKMEELQTANAEKDNTVEMLKTNITKLESDLVKKSDEISKLLKEIDSLKSRPSSVTPTLHRCKEESVPSRTRGKKSNRSGRSGAGKQESDTQRPLQKGSRGSSKRKAVEVVPVPDTPKLFTSSFKVPKLKSGV